MDRNSDEKVRIVVQKLYTNVRLKCERNILINEVPSQDKIAVLLLNMLFGDEQLKIAIVLSSAKHNSLPA